MKISDIIHYPIKSLAAKHLKEASLSDRGLKNDRRWMIVNTDYQFITQRKYPILNQITVEEIEEKIHLHNRVNSEDFQQKIGLKKEKVKVKVWRSVVDASELVDSGINDWLSNQIGENIQLVFMEDGDHRKMNPDYAKTSEKVSFADGYPVLITNTASLDEVNKHLEEPMTMDHFRANIVVDGNIPWEEEKWKRIRINDLILRVAKPCVRCKVINIDPKNASIQEKNLLTLRQVQNKVQITFGINCIVEKEGDFKLGDEIEFS